MTASKAPLSVRLKPALSEALDRHCASTGRTRSFVVQESVAQYLASHTGPTLHSLAEDVLPPLEARARPAAPRPRRHERYRAYVREKRRR